MRHQLHNLVEKSVAHSYVFYVPTHTLMRMATAYAVILFSSVLGYMHIIQANQFLLPPTEVYIGRISE